MALSREEKHVSVFKITYRFLSKGQFFGLSTFQFLAYFRRAIFYTFVIVYLSETLKLTTTEVTLLATIGMIANTVSQTTVWGRLLDRFHYPSAFVSIGEMVAGIGHVLVFVWHLQALESGNLRYAGYTIIIGLALIEVPWSMSNVGWSALVSDLTVDDERSKLMAMLSFIGGIGGIFGALSGGFLFLDGEGFINGILFYIPAAVMIASGLLVMLTIKQHELETVFKNTVDLNHVNTENFKDIPNRKWILAFLVALVFINFGRNSVILITQLYLAEDSGYNVGGEGLALFRNVASIAVMLWSLLINMNSLKGRDNELFIVGTICVPLAYVWLMFSPTFELSLISAFLIGSSQIIIEVSSYALISKMIPPNWRGRLFSLYNATFMLSFGIAGTLITGPLSDILITQGYSNLFAYRMAFIAAMMIVLVGFVIFIPIYRFFKTETLESNQD